MSIDPSATTADLASIPCQLTLGKKLGKTGAKTIAKELESNTTLTSISLNSYTLHTHPRQQDWR